MSEELETAGYNYYRWVGVCVSGNCLPCHNPSAPTGKWWAIQKKARSPYHPTQTNPHAPPLPAPPPQTPIPNAGV
jgi:hypothetical protein